MKNILILILGISLSFSNPVKAEEQIKADTETVYSKETLPQNENVSEVSDKEPQNQKEGLDSLPPSAETITINKSIEAQKINLPACDEAKLLEMATDYITSYFKATQNEGTLFRRYKHFILHNIDRFREEDISNYKTAKARPVSDIIADIRVNQGIMEENIRLCKNQSENRYASKMYMIIYPKENHIFQVRLVNLIPNQKENEKIGFVYTDESAS